MDEYAGFWLYDKGSGMEGKWCGGGFGGGGRCEDYIAGNGLGDGSSYGFGGRYGSGFELDYGDSGSVTEYREG